MMTNRSEPEILAAGGPVRHIPVLLNEAVAALGVNEGGAEGGGGRWLDGTFGAGGYTRAILARANARALALDRDPEAIAAGAAMVAEAQGRLSLVQSEFSRLDIVAEEQGFAPLDGVVLDIGVSSMQLDEAARGFSFRFEGPLDMRMSGAGTSAADLVNEADEAQLADIFYYYGEERAARRLARAIVHDRRETPFTTTRQLAEMIARVHPSRPRDIHPATRVFQALRIAVNDELGELVRALLAAERVLRPGGRLVVVTFHSLEDRIVKQFFAERSGRGAAISRHLPGEPQRAVPTFALKGKQPVTASEEEMRANPRARSAKLRFATRTDGAHQPGGPRHDDLKLLTLASLPARETRRR